MTGLRVLQPVSIFGEDGTHCAYVCIGVGGKGGNGGSVKQSSETYQTGDHNSGKTVRLHLLLALPSDGSIALHGA